MGEVAEAEALVEAVEAEAGSADVVADVEVDVVDSLIMDLQNMLRNWVSSRTPVKMIWSVSAPSMTFPTSTPPSSWKTNNRLVKLMRSSAHSRIIMCQ